MKTEWPKAATSQQRAATDELLRRLHVKYPGRILSTVLFGSVARGDFTPDSDIDVLVVTDTLDPDFKWGLWSVGSEVSLDSDVIFNLHLYSRALWDNLRTQKKTIWRNVERDGILLKPAPVPA